MKSLSSDQAVSVLAITVAASVGLAAGPVTWRLTDYDDGRRDVITAPAAAPPAAMLDLAPLRRFAPFGNKVLAIGPPGEASTLGLQLRGVLLARPASQSVAMIAAGTGPAKGFGIGALLPGGAIVDSIEFDLVIVRAGGQLVTLALPTKATHAAPAALPIAAAAAPGAGPVEPDGERTSDPFTLLGSLGATGSPEGYRIAPSLSEDLKRAGLQAGDLVEKVDGQSVGDPARDRALFDAAVVAGKMRVDVVRSGKHLTMSIPLH